MLLCHLDHHDDDGDDGDEDNDNGDDDDDCSPVAKILSPFDCHIGQPEKKCEEKTYNNEVMKCGTL